MVVKEPKEIMGSDPPSDPRPMTLTLYANGKLIPCDQSSVAYERDGVGVTVTFETTRNCIEVGSGDPRIERYWGEKQSGQLWFVRQPHPDGGVVRYPRGGCVIILDVVVPAEEEDGVRFHVHANTAVVDWTRDGNIAEAGDELDLPADWLAERA